MVTVLPKENDWGEAFSSIGKGITEGYMNRADEMALQKAYKDLPENATGDDVMKAILGVKTYSPERKQEFVKNVQEHQKTKQAGEIAKNKLQQKQEEKELKESEEKLETRALFKQVYPDKSPEEINQMAEHLKPADARSLITKPETVTEYKIAENNAERFKPTIKKYAENALGAKELMPITEASIINNEAYSTEAKIWDTLLDQAPSMFSGLKTKTGQELEAYTPISMSSFSQKMGGVFTNRKIELISKKAVGLGKDKEANRLFLYLDLADRKLDILKDQISNEIISENKYGLPPKDYDKEINERMKPYQKMINSDIDRLLKGELPKSPILRLDIQRDAEAQAPPGYVTVISPTGSIGYLTEEEASSPEYKEYRRF